MNTTWDERVEAFWSSADDAQPNEMLHAMQALIGERPEHDPDALYEWTSVHDFLGMEHQAIPLYRAALGHGLSGSRKIQGTIQLASSLRNIGEPEAAVELLQEFPRDGTTGAAADAFLALALRDAGRGDEALHIALTALARTLPLYSGAITNYARELAVHVKNE